MANLEKIKSGSKACPPACSGGAGYLYEYRVLTTYAILMLTNGFVPSFPNYTINELSFQTSKKGYLVDDFLIGLSSQQKHCKILGQIKRTIYTTGSNDGFTNPLIEAWYNYKNPQKFEQKNDKFFIITESLSRTDYTPVMWLLDNSRYLDFEDYITALNTPKVPPTDAKQKFELFKKIISSADESEDISDEKLYTFLRHLYILLYDLGRKESIIKSLFLSYISQFTDENPVDVWNAIFEYTSDMDAHGGTLIYNDIPDEVKAHLRSKRESQPTLYLQSATLSDFSFDEIEKEVSMPSIIPALLLGAWDDNNQRDQSIVEELVEASYKTWIQNLHRLAHKTNSPFKNINAIWTINNPQELIKHWESWIFEINITSFVKIVSIIFHNDIPDNCTYYSKNLCDGISTTIAILSSMKNDFTNVTAGRIDNYIDSILNIILDNSNTNYWANIENLLPLLAEASPFTFLRLLKDNIGIEPSPIKELFSNNSNDYNTDGIIRSLEILAWTPEFFKHACIILAQLATFDIRTAWRRSPVNSLRSILMPWHPHTLASISDRIDVLQYFASEYPDFAWEFLPDLLPDSHVSITRTTTPKYLTSIPENIPYPPEEEWQKTRIICEELIIQLAVKNTLTEWDKFITILPDFLDDAFNKFINDIRNNFDSYSEAKKFSIWESLSQLVIRHKNHKKDKWTMGQNRIEALDSIVELYKPKDLLNLNKRLFNTYNSDLISTETDYDYDVYHKELESKQIEAVQEIYNEGGIPRIIDFVNIVKRPSCVGRLFGMIGDSKTDQIILTNYLNTQLFCEQNFLRSYIWKRFQITEGTWIETIDSHDWTLEQKVNFLCYLPFCDKSWTIVDKWLGDQKQQYWESVIVNGYYKNTNYQYAIDNLLECKRYDVALSLLYDIIESKDYSVNINSIIHILNNLETWDNDQIQIISELIKYLQQQPNVDIDKMFDIELKYYSHKYRSFSYTPINVEKKLVQQPKLFCEYFALAYIPDNLEKVVDYSEEKRIVVSKLLTLFDNWSTIPGTDNNGYFSSEVFLSWFDSIYTEVEKIGYAGRFKYFLGKLLTKAPAADDGFWIHHKIANLLNRFDMEKMREGYYFKKTGVYCWVCSEQFIHDEQIKCDKYNKLANDSEDKGYANLAKLLKHIADFYKFRISDIRRRLEEDKQQYGE